MKDPKDQFQLGEQVIYLPEGVVTRVREYVWDKPMSAPAKILKYVLDCGVIASPGDVGKMPDRSYETYARHLRGYYLWEIIWAAIQMRRGKL